ncbi:heme oxygenase [Sutcliffiella cohnii]|uniref:Heme-degrading monooxygenase IsdG n=1 Tax=Sutcliffiella cohnii TaxID=33932 RepID=A0A223KPT1_9BACI|nr:MULTISPECIES: heme oxygenase [Sutcliffiella]AST91364.1 heme-degrading monooxygenase IsdG [Sutcliffiella cohnii]MED4015080.1 heme oxygenase [Sutcliffiella cohnii]WBL17195.1 heme oxygenase [Sutcliffiella sp. NC1]
MIVVTNRIKTKKGFAKKLAPNFTKEGPLQEMEGFIKVEVLVAENFEEYDELSVNMHWESHAHFMEWRNSDIFKQAHNRPKNADDGESPMLGSQIVVAEVASVLHALPKE